MQSCTSSHRLVFALCYEHLLSYRGVAEPVQHYTRMATYSILTKSQLERIKDKVGWPLESGRRQPVLAGSIRSISGRLRVFTCIPR